MILISSILPGGLRTGLEPENWRKLSQTGTCSDGSSVPASTTAVSLTLKDDGDTVTWEAPCGATAITPASMAMLPTCVSIVVRRKTQTDGTTIATTVTDGKLTLNDNILEVEFDLSLSLSGTITGTCDVVAEGSLNRLAE
ncbi:MAG: hypothetical protein IPM54_10570 [Polyangiaceae bacterium]|nr:hypothetical protein [Polyangiaceae bacterium]